MIPAISAIPAPALDITVHPADRAFTGPRPAVLVLPGGGFRVHTEHEGEEYARWCLPNALAWAHTAQWSVACEARLREEGIR